VKRIQVCSKEGDNPSPRGDNSKGVKMPGNLKKKSSSPEPAGQIQSNFSRTSRPNSIKLGTNYPWVMGIQICSYKGPGPIQRGDNHKNVKMGWDHLKNLLLQNHWANFD
jgi:hypothetical protein